MLTKKSILIGLLLLLVAAQLPAEEINGLPLHKEKLGERGIRLWLGEHESTTAVAALATKEGIVVIDTTDMPEVDAEFRKIIARELGRNDFRYLINTHEHADHTSGNSVYSDCEIIAHELAPEGIRNRADATPRVLGWYRENLPRMEAEVGEADSEEEAAKRKERLLAAGARFAAMEAGIEVTLPTITFSDRMRLDMGDMTLELFYAGSVHTASDIFVFVPEEGLLFTGDTMADVWHTESAGCLTSYMIRRDVKHNFPLLLENWKSLVARKDEIDDLIPGHWNGDLTFEGFENRYNYVKTLWEGIGKAVEAGESLDDVHTRFDLQKAFPELVDSPGITPRNHAASIVGVWCEITGADSAADALQARIDAVGIEKAIEESKAAREGNTKELYYLEDELNRLGYQYLSQEKLDEALAVFELNVHFYPESWNAYDSLGEAYMDLGDSDKAVELYEKSLELNPDNDNGREMLKRLGAGGKS